MSEKDKEVVICRCEEISKGELLEAMDMGFRTVSGLKRATRAGMGLCQGQTCQRQLIGLVASQTGQKPQDVEQLTPRPPARPLPMSVLADDPDNPERKD
jgi:NAD(P)H-nitrite reductase large subunit